MQNRLELLVGEAMILVRNTIAYFQFVFTVTDIFQKYRARMYIKVFVNF